MITTKTPRRSWAVGALVLSAILAGGAAQIKAADSTGKQQKVDHSQLTEKQAKALAARAETNADHMKLVAYYNSEANRFESDAKHHEELADVYRTSGGGVAVGGKGAGAGNVTQTAGHCDAIAKSLRDAAKASRELAAEHEQMAKEAAR
jgi:light-regulated signal transduction histidine kinase (bacteriophytochrome)